MLPVCQFSRIISRVKFVNWQFVRVLARRTVDTYKTVSLLPGQVGSVSWCFHTEGGAINEMENLVVPRGLLIARNPLEAGLDVESASRPIDHIQAKAIDLLAQSLRVFINLGGLARTRETDQVFPNVNSRPIAARNRESPSRISEETVDPLHLPIVNRQARGHTISLADLARPETAGHLIPQSIYSPSSSSISSTSRLGSIATPIETPRIEPRATRDESWLFLAWDLNFYTFPKKSIDVPYQGENAAASDFADAQQCNLQQTLTRKTTRVSKGIVGRASLTIRDRVYRTSLYGLCEKAKRKQEKIRRSPWVAANVLNTRYICYW